MSRNKGYRSAEQPPEGLPVVASQMDRLAQENDSLVARLHVHDAQGFRRACGTISEAEPLSPPCVCGGKDGARLAARQPAPDPAPGGRVDDDTCSTCLRPWSAHRDECSCPAVRPGSRPTPEEAEVERLRAAIGRVKGWCDELDARAVAIKGHGAAAYRERGVLAGLAEQCRAALIEGDDRG